jgi:hypothetical protein
MPRMATAARLVTAQPVTAQPVSGASIGRADLLRLIRAEYLQMPGLQLTPPQAWRLFGLDSTHGTAALDTLVEAKFLTVTRRGAYVRLETY